MLLRQRVNAKLTTLDSADFMFEGKGPDGPVLVGVERKTVSDLVQSLESARLQGMSTEHGAGQLQRMREAYDYSWLLIEGLWVTDAQGRLCLRRRSGTLRPIPGSMTEDSLTKRLLSLQLQGDIRIHQTSGQKQTAAWLSSLIRWWTDKVWDAHRTLQVVHRPTGLHPLSLFRERALALPGVGLAVAKALEGAFVGSEGKLLTATVNQIASTQIVSPSGPRRLGEAKAQSIVDALRKLR